MLGFLPGAKDRHAGNAAANHGDFIATVEAGTDLAVLEDFVRQLGFVFDNAESIFEKEIGDAREEAYGLDAMQFGLFDKSAENATTGALAFCFRLDDDGANFA